MRLVALLLATGAIAFGILAVAVSQLPHVGATGYRLPGGAGVLDATALTLLSGCSGVLGILGAVAFLLTSNPPRPLTARRVRLPVTRSMVVLAFGALALAGAVAVRWLG